MIAPRIIALPPKQFPPRITAPEENCPPWIIAPRTIAPKDNCPRGKLYLENCPRDICPSGKSPPCAFLLVEAIPSSKSHCFFWFRGIQRSPNRNQRMCIYAICRSSILKWQYFRDLFILFFEYNQNESTFNLRKLWRISESILRQLPPRKKLPPPNPKNNPNPNRNRN